MTDKKPYVPPTIERVALYTPGMHIFGVGKNPLILQLTRPKTIHEPQT